MFSCGIWLSPQLFLGYFPHFLLGNREDTSICTFVLHFSAFWDTHVNITHSHGTCGLSLGLDLFSALWLVALQLSQASCSGFLCCLPLPANPCLHVWALCFHMTALCLHVWALFSHVSTMFSHVSIVFSHVSTVSSHVNTLFTCVCLHMSVLSLHTWTLCFHMSALCFHMWELYLHMSTLCLHMWELCLHMSALCLHKWVLCFNMWALCFTCEHCVFSMFVPLRICPLPEVPPGMTQRRCSCQVGIEPSVLLREILRSLFWYNP